MKYGTVVEVIVSYIRKISPKCLSTHLDSYVHVLCVVATLIV